jgi:hypothetical protein
VARCEGEMPLFGEIGACVCVRACARVRVCERERVW